MNDVSTLSGPVTDPAISTTSDNGKELRRVGISQAFTDFHRDCGPIATLAGISLFALHEFSATNATFTELASR